MGVLSKCSQNMFLLAGSMMQKINLNKQKKKNVKILYLCVFPNLT